MKANRFVYGEDGVSSVVGGLLVFGLLVTVMVTVQTTFVPVWEHDREGGHMLTVQSQFSTLKSQAEAQATRQGDASISGPVTLQQAATYRFLQGSNLPGTLSFEPGAGDITLSSTEMRIVQSAGRSTAGAAEDWTSLPGSQTIANVSDVSHLRLRLLDVGSEDDGDDVTITITDANGQFAGSLTAYINRDPPDQFINTRVTRSDGEVIFDQGSFYHQTTTIPYWWIDALSPEMHFVDVLAAAAAPLRLDLQENGMHGEFTATYVETTTGGTVGSTGKLIPGWNEKHESGVLRFQSGNSVHVGQTYTLESGGVILSQADGQVMRIDPGLTVATNGVLTSIRLALPALAGSPDAVTGTGTATVTLDGRNRTHIIASAPDWRLQITTDHAAAWAASWERILRGAGLSQGAGHYLISTTAADATLTVYGQTTAPSSIVHDLSIEIHSASVHVRLQA